MFYLADLGEVQGVVEPCLVCLSIASSDNDMVDTLVFLESVFEEVQDSLVVRHVCLLEDRAWWLGGLRRVPVYRPVLNAFAGHPLSAGVIDISDYHISPI
jgi:hypothetical protein